MAIRKDIYRHIDWEKAAVLFKRPLEKPTSNTGAISVKDILYLVASSGALGMMFAFPGTIPAFSSLILGNKSYPRWRSKQAISELNNRKMVTVEEQKDGRVTVKITKRGMIRALSYQLDGMRLVQPKRWDKKWRLVIFDIPEKWKAVRDLFRMRLVQMGLYQLQESVYISPYPCFEEIEFLRELYGISFKTQYLLVEKIEDDEFIKSRFGLLT